MGRSVRRARRCAHIPVRRRGGGGARHVAGQDHDPHHVLQPAAVRRAPRAGDTHQPAAQAAVVSDTCICTLYKYSIITYTLC